MTEFDLSQISSADPATFASMIKSAPKSQLEGILGGEQRTEILGQIFGRFPGQFRADRAGSTNAIIHWTITGGPGGSSDTFEFVIANGTCVLSPKPEHEPKLAVTVGGTDFLQLISGGGNPMAMFMTGKLKAKGDLGLAANLANLCDLPKG
jgi:putative sterol carrier protein